MKELTLKLGTLRSLEARPGPAAFASALGEQGWYSIIYLRYLVKVIHTYSPIIY